MVTEFIHHSIFFNIETGYCSLELVISLKNLTQYFKVIKNYLLMQYNIYLYIFIFTLIYIKIKNEV